MSKADPADITAAESGWRQDAHLCEGQISAAGNIASDNGSGLENWEKSLRACPKY